MAHRAVHTLWDRDACLVDSASCLLPYGNGRSYGDVCLNAGADLLLTRGLDRFIHFDRFAGTLACEAGVLLDDILDLIVPQGWFLPVTPGTSFVTVGGAVANDVHGKNHHVAGSFGHHVRRLALQRSDGSLRQCSAVENPDWLAATIGGLGLTGLITWVEFSLIPIANAGMLTQTSRFHTLDAFWEINAASERRWPYTVAWVDGRPRRSGDVRGVYFAGCHAPPGASPPPPRRARSVPFSPPWSLVSRPTIRAFNSLYFRKPWPRGVASVHYRPYFYPLDGVRNWNRIYGQAGFLQHQSVLPPAAMQAGIAALLARAGARGQGSFLTVLKTFGTRSPPGMLSFARPGATLTLDFPYRGRETLRLLDDLDGIVAQAGGAVYPAKDARMSPALFRAGFPAWQDFAAWIDPRFSSSFWRRVSA